MNDPKTLQIIAEKACQFDRAHFDDDVPAAVDSLLSNHERLPADRKLITRLRPRYAVALGFFEGYALAIEDNDELRRERDELQTKLAEAERTGAEHAAQLEDEIRAIVAERDRYKREATESKNQANIGIVIKPPPPPPPPAAPPAPNELRTEIDDELAQAAADCANDEEGYLTTARDIDEVHDAMKAGKGWYAVARAFVHGARWQLSRIENAHAGDDPTMHFPPAFDQASMPSDREIAELVCRAIYTWREHTDDDIEHVVNVLNCEREDLRRKIGMFSGSTAEACAVKFALLHFRDRLVGPANEVQNAERAQYETTIRQKNERIAELEKQLGFDCIGGTEKGEGVEAKLELKIQKQNDLLRSLVGLSSSRSATPVSGSGELYVENGNVMFRNASGDASVVAASKPESEACDAIVFRDDAERDYWEEMSYVLATKKDTTSQSVATAADEMVEERRKRLSVRIVSENGSRPAIVGVHAADEVTDELLLEAAKFANESELFTSPADKLPPDRELECAKKAMREDCVMTWYRVCRAYVNGALRSSREL